MITYNFETEFDFDNEEPLREWLSDTIALESFKEGDINFVFCDDIYLHKLNVKHLNHNTLTDVITFNYNVGKLLSSDIFISVERVDENAKNFKVFFNDELHRVMIHGILHLCGYNDKTQEEKIVMRNKEDYYLSLRAV